jgi:hypothetical protein
MMKLPNADRAVVDIGKLRDYSLNPTHEEGMHKARVFHSALGFKQDDAERLRRMILSEILTADATPRPDTAYGHRYVVEFDTAGLKGPVRIRTTWLVRFDEDIPRLTSCYIP